MAKPDENTAKFKIFRAKDAKGLMEAGCMTVEPFSETARAGMDKAISAGYLGGDDVRIMTDMPGFAITNVWFKPGYNLPLHSHDADCMYYIVAGSIRLGTEDLGPRDSFFVPKDVPYTYKIGPEGVELLEIRHETKINFVNHAKGEAFWERAYEDAKKHSASWPDMERPKVNA
jgi:mannose-6-phosphate isomerase-like protein (cupin superfamily)